MIKCDNCGKEVDEVTLNLRYNFRACSEECYEELYAKKEAEEVAKFGAE